MLDRLEKYANTGALTKWNVQSKNGWDKFDLVGLNQIWNDGCQKNQLFIHVVVWIDFLKFLRQT